MPILRVRKPDTVILDRVSFLVACYRDRSRIERLLGRFDRRPGSRREARFEMDIADGLQLRRDVLIFEEFSPTWNGRPWSWP